MEIILNLHKMAVEHNSEVTYFLSSQDKQIKLNDHIGKNISFEFLNEINCIHCGKKTKKSFGGGYCYPHFASLACADICMVRPEKCHFHLGTCREEEWGKKTCFSPHIVYLANSSALKVGITRETQVPTRWMDQGASFALPILKVPTRLSSGLVETMISSEISDKTNWRKMLKNEIAEISLEEKRDLIVNKYREELEKIDGLEFLNEKVYEFNYPVTEYPQKIKSMSFDKMEVIEGVLKGIKGQYLILDTGVINIRKHAGYKVKLTIGD